MHHIIHVLMPYMFARVCTFLQGAVTVLAGHPAGSGGSSGGTVPGAGPHTLLQRQRRAGGGGGVFLHLLRVSLSPLLTH